MAHALAVSHVAFRISLFFSQVEIALYRRSHKGTLMIHSTIYNIAIIHSFKKRFLFVQLQSILMELLK